uniref:SCAN box domain-containing protein n=1 Tax=Pelusios castaneus TaxID=367368 RepID=A0A8C8RIB1_9SAUR
MEELPSAEDPKEPTAPSGSYDLEELPSVEEQQEFPDLPPMDTEGLVGIPRATYPADPKEDTVETGTPQPRGGGSSPGAVDINPEAFRRRFRGKEYHQGVWLRALAQELKDACRRWLQPDRCSKEDLIDQMVMEQFLHVIPSRGRTWLSTNDRRGTGEDLCPRGTARGDTDRPRIGVHLPVVPGGLCPPWDTETRDLHLSPTDRRTSGAV